MKEYLPNLKTPCLIYAGDNDPIHSKAKYCAEIMPFADFVSLPGLNHGTGFTRSDLVLPLVMKFLEKL